MAAAREAIEAPLRMRRLTAETSAAEEGLARNRKKYEELATKGIISPEAADILLTMDLRRAQTESERAQAATSRAHGGLYRAQAADFAAGQPLRAREREARVRASEALTAQRTAPTLRAIPQAVVQEAQQQAEEHFKKQRPRALAGLGRALLAPFRGTTGITEGAGRPAYKEPTQADIMSKRNELLELQGYDPRALRMAGRPGGAPEPGGAGGLPGPSGSPCPPGSQYNTDDPSLCRDRATGRQFRMLGGQPVEASAAEEGPTEKEYWD